MSLSHGLLGLLSYGPMTGYDLKRLFDDSINFFWSAQQSQIYRELKMWENAGCVTSEVQPGDRGPDKRVYRITELGRSRLREWLLAMPDHIQEDDRNAFVLRVFLLPHVGIDEMMDQIRRRLDKYRRDLEDLKAVEGRMSEYARRFGAEADVPYWKIVLSRGYHDVESHIHWAEESLEYLQRLQQERGGR